MAKTIRYGDSSFTLRLEFPSSWPVKTSCPTAVTISIEDGLGSELLAATATTLLAAHNTGATCSAGDTSLTLAATPPAYAAGDRLLLTDGVTAPSEFVEVQAISGTTLYLTEGLAYDHATAKSLKPLFCTYALDASTAADYPIGSDRLLIWTPNTDAPLYEELARVEGAEWGSGEIREAVSAYPVASKLIGDKWDTIYEQARRWVDRKLKMEGLDLDALREPDAAEDAIVDRMLVLAYRQTSALDTYETELKDAQAASMASMVDLAALAHWWDDDRDDTKDDGEVRRAEVPLIPRGY